MNKEYTAPRFEVIELVETDIICTSSAFDALFTQGADAGSIEFYRIGSRI